MTPAEYYRRLTPRERDAFARAVDSSRRYIEGGLLRRRPGDRPGARKDLMERIAAASNGFVSYRECVEYFYLDQAPDPDEDPGESPPAAVALAR